MEQGGHGMGNWVAEEIPAAVQMIRSWRLASDNARVMRLAFHILIVVSASGF